MKYEAFVDKTSAYPFFGKEVLSTLEGKPGSLSLQLHRWCRSNKLIRLKRGLYTLPDDRRKERFSLRWLANAIYSPSYLSLEHILFWYDLIPERVETITSITLLKTATFQNPLGTFVYRNLKKELFFGFEEILDEYRHPVLLASPEKAVLDYIYLYPGWESTVEFIEQGIRLQQMEQLKKRKLKAYGKKFQSKKINDAIELLISII